jgi:hypothetical protein
MRDTAGSFKGFVEELDALQKRRQEIIGRAFEVLENMDGELSSMLCLRFKTRAQAAAWMSHGLREWEGRSAYELLAMGEVDRVWEKLLDN